MLPEKFSATLQHISFNAVPAGGERLRKIATVTLRVTTEQLGPLPTHDLDAIVGACAEGVADRVQVGQTCTPITLHMTSSDSPTEISFEASQAQVKRLVFKRADDENGDPVVWCNANIACEITAAQSSVLVAMLRHSVTVQTAAQQLDLIAEPEAQPPKRRRKAQPETAEHSS